MVTLAGVKSGKDTGHVPIAEVHVLLLVDPSGALTATVTGVEPGAPVTSTTNPVQPISVQAVGPATPHPEPQAATRTRAIINTSRGIVTGQILACDDARRAATSPPSRCTRRLVSGEGIEPSTRRFRVERLLARRRALTFRAEMSRYRNNSIRISSSSLPSIMTCRDRRPHSTKPSRR